MNSTNCSLLRWKAVSGEIMAGTDAAERYFSLPEPSSADHLWRYTTLQSMHPESDLDALPHADSALVEVTGAAFESIDEQSAPPYAGIMDKAIALNLALSKRSYHITCGPSTVVSVHGDGGPSSARLFLDVPEGMTSEVTLTITTSDWLGLVIEGRIASDAHLRLLFLDRSGSEATLLRHESWTLDEHASARFATLSLGGGRRKSHLTLNLLGQGASLDVGVSTLGQDQRHDDHHILVRHGAPDTTSRLRIHGVCDGHSKTIGTGRLIVSEEAHRADAGQVFRNLMLSKDAVADSIPELEVLVDDVSATHGAASASVDEEQITYLNTRGLDREEATSLIAEGFLAAPIRSVLSAGLFDTAIVQLNGWLGSS